MMASCTSRESLRIRRGESELLKAIPSAPLAPVTLNGTRSRQANSRAVRSDCYVVGTVAVLEVKTVKKARGYQRLEQTSSSEEAEEGWVLMNHGMPTPLRMPDKI